MPGWCVVRFTPPRSRPRRAMPSFHHEKHFWHLSLCPQLASTTSHTQSLPTLPHRGREARAGTCALLSCPWATDFFFSSSSFFPSSRRTPMANVVVAVVALGTTGKPAITVNNTEWGAVLGAPPLAETSINPAMTEVSRRVCCEPPPTHTTPCPLSLLSFLFPTCLCTSSFSALL